MPEQRRVSSNETARYKRITDNLFGSVTAPNDGQNMPA